MADVFISYKREDRSRVERVARALRDFGFEVWFDASLTAGEAFDEEIEREVHAARAVLVLWSSRSVKSRWVKNEAAAGLERGVLVAARVDDCKLPLAFRDIHCEPIFSLTGNLAEPGWSKVVARISNLTGKRQAATPPPGKDLHVPTPDRTVRVAQLQSQNSVSPGPTKEILRRRVLVGIGAVAVPATATALWLSARKTPPLASPPGVESLTQSTPGSLQLQRRDDELRGPALALSDGGHWLAYSANDQSVRVMNLATGQDFGAPINSTRSSIYSAAISVAGDLLALGDFRTVQLFDVLTGRRLWSLRQENLWWDVNSLEFTHNGNRLLVPAARGVAVIDVRSSTIERVLPVTGDFSSGGVCVSPDDRFAVGATCSEGKQYVWDISTGDVVATVAGLRRLATFGQANISFSRDGAAVLLNGNDDTFVYRSMPNLSEQSRLPADYACIAGDQGQWIVRVRHSEQILEVLSAASREVLTSVEGVSQINLVARASSALVVGGTESNQYRERLYEISAV